MLQGSTKRPLSKAMSMMDLGETVDFDEGNGNRAPPCKRPRRTDEVLRGLDSPDVVGPQTVSCPMGSENKLVLVNQLILVNCDGTQSF